MSNLNSLTQGIVSVITFLQNLGASANLPNVELPQEMRNIFQYVSKFLDTVLTIIPKIPAFDVRAQLMILCLAIPLVLDIVFVWFVSPFFDVLFHVFDLVTVVIVTMMITESIIQNLWTAGAKFVIALGLLYLVMRIGIRISQYRKKIWKMSDLACSICNHYMAGIIPGVQTTMARDDLNEAISQFSRIVEIQVRPPTIFYIVSIVIVIVALLFLSFWSVGLFPFMMTCPPAMSVFFPYVGFPFAAILIVAFIMSLTECGRRANLCLKRFAKRWGLRLLMLCLDLLYIPILTNLVTNCAATQMTCGEGKYLEYDRLPSLIDPDPLFDFVNHSAKCVVCNQNMVSLRPACKAACSGAKEWRLIEAPNLLLIDDVLRILGGIMLYTVFAVMLGIPILWAYVIHRNRSFTHKINIYGATAHDKWRHIVHRMHTTGNFLFAYYKHDASYWSIFIFFVKIVVMVITTVAGRIWTPIIICLPIWYFIVVVVYAVKMPYLYKTNNILDIMLYTGNCIFAVIPVFAKYGYQMNSNVFLPLSIILVVIPVISLIVMICCKHRVYDINDPTMSEKERKKQKTKKGKETKEQKEERKKRQRKLSRHQRKTSIDDIEDDMDELDVDVHRRASSPRRRSSMSPKKSARGKSPSRKEREIADMEAAMNLTTRRRAHFIQEMKREVGDDMGEMVTIEDGYMDTIEYARACERLNLNKSPGFRVGQMLIMKRATHMYRTLDVVIDGSTIELLTETLKWAMLFASVAFGWYIGGLRGTLRIRSDVVCS